GLASFQEAEPGPAGDRLLAEAVGLLTVEGHTGLERVFLSHKRDVVLDGPPRLVRAVVRRAAPPGVAVREGDLAHVDVAIDGILETDRILPVASDVEGSSIVE